MYDGNNRFVGGPKACRLAEAEPGREKPSARAATPTWQWLAGLEALVLTDNGGPHDATVSLPNSPLMNEDVITT